jgi:hypothetical protein
VVTVERPVDRTVDTVITGGPSGTVDTDKVTFGFEPNVEGATFECSLDDGPFAPCDPTTVFSVSEGPHIFQVRAVAAGDNVDQTPASRAFTVDLPDEPALSDPPVVRDDGGSTGEAAAVSNAFISQYASSRARTPTGLYQFDTSESSYRLNQVGAKIAGPVNAIGYRSTDQSLYGYRLTGTPGIVRIDPKTGAVLEDLGIPQGLPAKSYFAGDVSPDGSTYYLYANRTGVLWVVDLGTFTASSVRLSSPIDVADFAVSPNDGNLYSVATNGRLVQVDPRTGRVTARALAGLKPGLYGATWFTAQGDLIADQNAVSRTRGVMIWIADPTTTPRVVSKQAGPRTYGNDGAAYVASPDPAGLSVVVDVLANDGDPAGSLDPSTLQIQIVQPSHGTATVNEVDKTIMYTSDSTYSGTDSFTYKVCAADAPERCSSSATVNITSAPIQSSAAAPNG